MIFLWGLAGDRPLATVRQELARLGRTAVLLDQRAVLDTRIEVDVGDALSCTAYSWFDLDGSISRRIAAHLAAAAA